jgi:hypothetical protein
LKKELLAVLELALQVAAAPSLEKSKHALPCATEQESCVLE